MKRFLACLLILATMLGLCACGKADQRKALSDMGITNREDQDTLIEAANSLYAEDTSNKPKSDAQMEKIYEESRKQYGSQLEGKWIQMPGSNITYYDSHSWMKDPRQDVYSFEGSICNTRDYTNLQWMVEDEKILVGSGLEREPEKRWGVRELELMQVCGFDILSVTQENRTKYFVREENAEALFDAMYLVVELNTENVKDYYELIEVRQDVIDSFKEKTGSYRNRIFLCNTAYKEGLYCIGCKDVLIEVNVPEYTCSKGIFKHYIAETKRISNPNCDIIIDTYSNISPTNEIKAEITPEELTIGRAKGTLKYLRPEFIDHIEKGNWDYTIYDIFGNEYTTIGFPFPPSEVTF